MDAIFGPEFADFLVTYVDDILVMSSSFTEHLEHLGRVFRRLEAAGMTLRLNKCQFFREQMPYLGYVLTTQGVRPDPTRVQAIQDYVRPRNVKELQKFLGFCQYNRIFTSRFAEITSPLTLLLKKKASWRWDSLQENAFQELKRELQSEVLLFHPDPQLPWHVQVDASDVGIAGILFQVVDGVQKVVAYGSRLLLDRERRYSSFEKEVLAALYFMHRWRVYLLGSSFILHTDCKAATYINSCRLLSPRVTRWALALQEFDYQVEHVPGHENGQADVLSRHACARYPVPADKCFTICSLQLPCGLKPIFDNFRFHQSRDDKLQQIITRLDTDEKLQRMFLLHNNILYKRGSNEGQVLLCIPQGLVSDFIKAYHEAFGHFGIHKTWVAMRRELWWTNMHRKIKQQIKSCDICQRAKISSMPKPSQMQIIPASKDDIIAMDIYGPLVRSRGGASYLLVILNLFTKHVALYPLKKATSRAMLNRVLNDYLPTYGNVQRILHDHGTQFTSRLWRNTMSDLGIRLVYSSVRHACSNPSERVMRELGRLFRTYCAEQHSRWAWEVPKFCEFLNSVVHESTGCTPDELQLGKEPPVLLPSGLIPGESRVASPSSQSKLILAEAMLRGKAARRAINHPGRPWLEFKPGDLVLLRANNASSALKSETKKFLLLFEGPYRIKKKISQATYVLQCIESDSERGTFHASHLKLYHEPACVQ